MSAQKTWSSVEHLTAEGFSQAATQANFATCFYLRDNGRGAKDPKEMLVYETVIETEDGPEHHTFKQKTPAKPRKEFESAEYIPFDTVESWTAPVREAIEGAGGIFAYGHIFAHDAKKDWKDDPIPSFEISLSNLSGVSYSQGKEQKKRRDAFFGMAKVLGAEELWQWGNYAYATGFEGRSLDKISFYRGDPVLHSVAPEEGLPEIKKHESEYEPGARFVCTTMPPKYSKTVRVN